MCIFVKLPWVLLTIVLLCKEWRLSLNTPGSHTENNKRIVKKSPHIAGFSFIQNKDAEATFLKVASGIGKVTILLFMVTVNHNPVDPNSHLPLLHS